VKEEKFIGDSIDSLQFGKWKTSSQWTPAEKLAEKIESPPKLEFKNFVPLKVPEPKVPHLQKNSPSIGNQSGINLESDPNLRRQDIFNLVQQIETGDLKLQLEAITKLRKYLSIEVKPPIQDAVDSGAPSRLISLLQVATDPVLQVLFFNIF
jgi:hypothetical protein